jgi:hypothetical protein
MTDQTFGAQVIPQPPVLYVAVNAVQYQVPLICGPFLNPDTANAFIQTNNGQSMRWVVTVIAPPP